MDSGEILQNKIVGDEGLTFDDLLLLPGYTDFKRKAVDLTSQLHPRLVLKLLVIASPMDTVCETEMAIAMAQHGGLGIIHRNLTVETQAVMAAKVKERKLFVGAAVGVGPDMERRTQALIAAGTDVIVVDSGHGHSQFVINTVLYLKKNYPQLPVMAGNVATYEGACSLVEAGADILRVGMGPGSICTTRIVTGVGVPQMTAISESVRAAAGSKVTIVADGGIRQIGDMAKALAVGADAIMLGSLLARFDEAPGATVSVNGKKYKPYRGMGSVAAMKSGAAERYGQSAELAPKTLIAEGIEGLVDHQGKVGDYLTQIEGSLRSAFYYVGAKTLPEFFAKARFIKVSRAGLLESHPHSVVIQNPGRNYTL